MFETEGEESISVEPENVLVFYRNDFRSATSIKIIKNRQFDEAVTFELKCTNRAAYLVSERTGELTPNQRHKYITILINDSASLEECIHDRFKLVLKVPKKGPLQRKFKVIIDYKKEEHKPESSNNLHWEMNSKSSGTVASSATTVTPSLAAVKKTLLKKMGSIALTPGDEKPNPQQRIKQQLDEVVKAVEQRRRHLSFLDMQISKNKSKRRIMTCITLLVMIVMLGMGVFARKMVVRGVNYGNEWLKSGQF